MKKQFITDQEKEFIERQNLDLSNFINANQNSIPSIRRIMEVEDKHYAYNAIPCVKGHQLRHRSGHCIQCSTASIGFRKNWYRPAYIYIAGSKRSEAVKVGTTINKDNRVNQLRKSFKCTDWEILYSIWCDESGRLEYEVQSKLIKYLKNDYYHHNYHTQKSKEVYRCSYFTALNALKHVLKENALKDRRGLSNVAFPSDYDFPNLAIKVY